MFIDDQFLETRIFSRSQETLIKRIEYESELCIDAVPFDFWEESLCLSIFEEERIL